MLIRKTINTFCCPARPFFTYWSTPEYTKSATLPGLMPVWNGREYKFPNLCSPSWMTNLSFVIFSQEEGYVYTSNIYFYDRNPAGKDLDFDCALEQKEPFMMYAVSFQLQNRPKDLSRLSLPYLSDIAHGVVLETNHLHRFHTPARKALDTLLRSTDSTQEWVPEQGPDLLYGTGLNRHLGDNGIISP